MTSFGAKGILHHGYMPTFKIQGQICPRAGSLLPLNGEDAQFLQIYFMGDSSKEEERRCGIQPDMNNLIVRQLQELLQKNNALVIIFRTALEIMPLDDDKLIIKADKTPIGEHKRRFNVPTLDEVAIVITGQEFGKRDIILQKRGRNLERISETHRSYDALQYTVLFWDGDVGITSTYSKLILQLVNLREKRSHR